MDKRGRVCQGDLAPRVEHASAGGCGSQDWLSERSHAKPVRPQVTLRLRVKEKSPAQKEKGIPLEAVLRLAARSAYT